MTDYSAWTTCGGDLGDVMYVHTPCNREIDVPLRSNLAADLALIDAHECPGPPGKIAGRVFPHA